jgi:hypothetical protein
LNPEAPGTNRKTHAGGPRGRKGKWDKHRGLPKMKRRDAEQWIEREIEKLPDDHTVRASDLIRKMFGGSARANPRPYTPRSP